MTEKELIEKYNLQNCTFTFINEPNFERMTKGFTVGFHRGEGCKTLGKV